MGVFVCTFLHGNISFFYTLMSACFKDYDFGIAEFVLLVYIVTRAVVFMLSRLLLIALSLLLLSLMFVLVILLLLLSLNSYYLFVFTLISMLSLLLVYYRKLNLVRLVT